jgi:hypothetical protein
VTTIAVPKQTEYEDAGTAFDGMASNLLAASALTQNLDFLPGNFPEAETLREAVDIFCRERQMTLEIYAEACRYIGDILRLCGEAYTSSETQRVEKGSDLESKLGSAIQGLQRLHTRLDEVRKHEVYHIVRVKDLPTLTFPIHQGPGPATTGSGPVGTILGPPVTVSQFSSSGPSSSTPTLSSLPVQLTTTTPAPAPAPAPANTSTGGSRKA